MNKPRHPAVIRFVPAGPGGGGLKAGAVTAEVYEVGGKLGDKAPPPPPEGHTSGRKSTRPHRSEKRQRKRRAIRKGKGK